MKFTLRDILWTLVGGLLLALVSLHFFPAGATASIAPLEAHAIRMESKYDLPPGLLRAICEQESHWRNLAGRHGEIGVCQVKPTTVAMICAACVGNAGQKVFAVGSHGDSVARIQAVLAREKMYSAEIDGVYGPQTQSAVVAYQRKAKVAVDGVVGRQTWAAMFGADDVFPGQAIAESLWDPHQNIEWAAKYLAWLRANVSSDPHIMAAAYNGGPAHPVVTYMLQVRGRM